MDPTNIVCDLCTSYTVNSGATVFSFKLDPKAKFLDGTAIDAAAVKFSAERAIGLKSDGRSEWTGVEAANPPTVTTPDSTTVVLTLAHPNVMLKATLAIFGPPSILEPTIFNQHPAASGATQQNRRPDRHWRLARASAGA
jgi:peptide/nickel transport system substrate-binding protein